MESKNRRDRKKERENHDFLILINCYNQNNFKYIEVRSNVGKRMGFYANG
jgi:hypothetical protein